MWGSVSMNKGMDKYWTGTVIAQSLQSQFILLILNYSLDASCILLAHIRRVFDAIWTATLILNVHSELQRKSIPLVAMATVTLKSIERALMWPWRGGYGCGRAGETGAREAFEPAEAKPPKLDRGRAVTLIATGVTLLWQSVGWKRRHGTRQKKKTAAWGEHQQPLKKMGVGVTVKYD